MSKDEDEKLPDVRMGLSLQPDLWMRGISRRTNVDEAVKYQLPEVLNYCRMLGIQRDKSPVTGRWMSGETRAALEAASKQTGLDVVVLLRASLQLFKSRGKKKTATVERILRHQPEQVKMVCGRCKHITYAPYTPPPKCGWGTCDGHLSPVPEGHGG